MLRAMQPRDITHALSSDVAAALRAHAELAFPHECCGALLADGSGISRALPLENVATDPSRGFAVSARDYLRAEAEADASRLTLAGFYHSHPGGPAEPSPRDAATAWSGWCTVIVPVSAEGEAGAPRTFWYDEASRTFREGAP